MKGKKIEEKKVAGIKKQIEFKKNMDAALQAAEKKKKQAFENKEKFEKMKADLEKEKQKLAKMQAKAQDIFNKKAEEGDEELEEFLKQQAEQKEKEKEFDEMKKEIQQELQKAKPEIDKIKKLGIDAFEKAQKEGKQIVFVEIPAKNGLQKNGIFFPDGNEVKPLQLTDEIRNQHGIDASISEEDIKTIFVQLGTFGNIFVKMLTPVGICKEMFDHTPECYNLMKDICEKRASHSDNDKVLFTRDEQLLLLKIYNICKTKHLKPEEIFIVQKKPVEQKISHKMQDFFANHDKAKKEHKQASASLNIGDAKIIADVLEHGTSNETQGQWIDIKREIKDKDYPIDVNGRDVYNNNLHWIEMWDTERKAMEQSKKNRFHAEFYMEGVSQNIIDKKENIDLMAFHYIAAHTENGLMFDKDKNALQKLLTDYPNFKKIVELFKEFDKTPTVENALKVVKFYSDNKRELHYIANGFGVSGMCGHFALFPKNPPITVQEALNQTFGDGNDKEKFINTDIFQIARAFNDLKMDEHGLTEYAKRLFQAIEKCNDDKGICRVQRYALINFILTNSNEITGNMLVQQNIFKHSSSATGAYHAMLPERELGECESNYIIYGTKKREERLKEVNDSIQFEKVDIDDAYQKLLPYIGKMLGVDITNEKNRMDKIIAENEKEIKKKSEADKAQEIEQAEGQSEFKKFTEHTDLSAKTGAQTTATPDKKNEQPHTNDKPSLNKKNENENEVIKIAQPVSITSSNSGPAPAVKLQEIFQPIITKQPESKLEDFNEKKEFEEKIIKINISNENKSEQNKIITPVSKNVITLNKTTLGKISEQFGLPVAEVLGNYKGNGNENKINSTSGFDNKNKKDMKLTASDYAWCITIIGIFYVLWKHFHIKKLKEQQEERLINNSSTTIGTTSLNNGSSLGAE